MKFTEEQIKSWLQGFFVVDTDGNLISDLSLKSIINLVDDEQDGIAACAERGALYDFSEYFSNYTKLFPIFLSDLYEISEQTVAMVSFDRFRMELDTKRRMVFMLQSHDLSFIGPRGHPKDLRER